MPTYTTFRTSGRGKDKVMGFFVGQIMKEMKGKVNPCKVRETLMKEVEKRK